MPVLRLMTRLNLVGCSTGISAGFAPRNILSTNSAARRNRSGKLGPYESRAVCGHFFAEKVHVGQSRFQCQSADCKLVFEEEWIAREVKRFHAIIERSKRWRDILWPGAGPSAARAIR